MDVFGNKDKDQDKDDDQEDENTSSDDDEACGGCGGNSQLQKAENERDKERRKLKRLKKKPDQLRRELFEVILRKRIFLTDRMEKVEKLLVMYGVVDEKQMLN